MTTLGGFVWIVTSIWVQADLNWSIAYGNVMLLLGKTAALTCFALVLLWGALLINHVSPEDWFAIKSDMAIAVVWSSLFMALAFAWAWG